MKTMIPCIYPKQGLFYATQEETEHLHLLTMQIDAIDGQTQLIEKRYKLGIDPGTKYDWLYQKSMELIFERLELFQKIQLRNQIERELNG